jgi:hypothetical protein
MRGMERAGNAHLAIRRSMSIGLPQPCSVYTTPPAARQACLSISNRSIVLIRASARLYSSASSIGAMAQPALMAIPRTNAFTSAPRELSAFVAWMPKVGRADGFKHEKV